MKTGYYALLICLILGAALGGCFGVRSAHNTINISRLQGKANLVPILVIGSGPAGLMAALYGARGGKDTWIIEGNNPGGLLMGTTEVANWPGEVLITGPEIIGKLRKQAEYQGVHFLQDSVAQIDTSCWPYLVHTENGNRLHALTIIIATGASPRYLNIPGEQEYWGAGVTACAVCDAPFYKEQQVVVVGGGDSAVEEAIQLAAYAAKIILLVRKDTMRAAKSMQDRLKAYPNISINFNVSVKEIVGDGTKVTGVVIYHHKTKLEVTIPTDGVFLAVGHTPNTAFLQRKIPTNKEGYITVKGRTQESAISGIFAAGDVSDHQYRQAGSSAGYGIAAGLDAVRFLDDHGYTPAIAEQIQAQLYTEESNQATLSGLQDEAIYELFTMEQFNELMQQKNVVFMDFWSSTCPSCKQMLPIFQSVASLYKDKATFVTVNVDTVPEVVDQLFVHKIPCLLVLKDGLVVSKFTSTMSKLEMIAFVDQVLA